MIVRVLSLGAQLLFVPSLACIDINVFAKSKKLILNLLLKINIEVFVFERQHACAN